ncbi:phosphoglucosamine mutase [Eubacteriales bacterium OttesenSCG-928-K08]|nr:phosphoglucosamine mutase [Eubacteriales bacterium OttesenSCG-928-K08]
MGRLFGTDGVRGIANESLTCELAMKIGAAGAHVLASEIHTPRILIGTDTRKSGDMLTCALAAGICAVGGDVVQCGVVPTPALSYLVQLYGADAGVMVSASHNSMEYNGIKWFNGQGLKLSDELEDKIEAVINDNRPLPRPVGGEIGRVTNVRRAKDEYREFLQRAADVRYEGLLIALDCANGAASAIARDVFVGLGAEVMSFSDAPDGYNINDQCGSTHPEHLQQIVYEMGADVGLAFDGDADRLIAVDERGRIVDGDRIMGICALDMLARGVLKNDTLAITVMSNLGLKRRMEQAGIRIEETSVGDRYVLERMLEKGLNLGGEQSGHLIFTDYHTTGDGMLSAIQLLNVLKRSGKRMSTLAREIPIYPQVLVNVKLSEDKKTPALEDEQMAQRIKEAEKALGETGRVLVRASGTEPLIRIMLEGQDENEIRSHATAIAKVLEKNHSGKIRM